MDLYVCVYNTVDIYGKDVVYFDCIYMDDMCVCGSKSWRGLLYV